eukprot:scaffold481_cov102-Skeletonema_dohrnii-CCMP3373.AAC.8
MSMLWNDVVCEDVQVVVIMIMILGVRIEQGCSANNKTAIQAGNTGFSHDTGVLKFMVPTQIASCV